MDRNNIEKIAQSPEDKLLLAKLWDKINAGIRKNIPANTCFLSPRELEMAKYLFGEPEGLYAFGGYADSERKMLVYLPEYLEEDGSMIFDLADAIKPELAGWKYESGKASDGGTLVCTISKDGQQKELTLKVSVVTGDDNIDRIWIEFEEEE